MSFSQRHTIRITHKSHKHLQLRELFLFDFDMTLTLSGLPLHDLMNHGTDARRR